MRRGILAVLSLMLAGIAHAGAAAPGTAEEEISLPLFGMVKVYRPEPVSRARGLILFVSGDGGWNLGVIDMARRSAAEAIVVGLSMPAWRKAAEKDSKHCWYPAGEMESTAQAVEKIYHVPRYVQPLLVGYSSGATLVYAALAQAPAATFAGAISLGFCDELEVARPVCSQASWKPTYREPKRLSLLPPRPDLAPGPDGAPRWLALQGQVDQVCDPAEVGAFTSKISAARLIPLPSVGHGFSVPRNWGAQYDQAVASLLPAVPAWDAAARIPASSENAALVAGPDNGSTQTEIARRLETLDLPLHLDWPEGATRALVFVSGDGGWAELDRRVSSLLAGHGVGVVGLDTLRYFWAPKNPKTFRADLARVIDLLPRGLPVYAGGYSFGAEVVPVSIELPTRLAGLVLLAPGPWATFEVSPLDWIRTGTTPSDHPVALAIGRLGATTGSGGLRVLCVDAADHSPTGCPAANPPGILRLTLPGGHHFSGDYETLAARILDFLGD